jgi:hypothetical protein
MSDRARTVLRVATVTPSSDPAVCCGQGGAWAPPAGQPVVIGCMLCPRSATYWRTHRADGRPYEPVRPLGDGPNGPGLSGRQPAGSNSDRGTRPGPASRGACMVAGSMSWTGSG